MNPLKKLLLGVSLSFFAASGWAATYYVSTSGNDNESGKSTSQALKTLPRALMKINSGDSVLLRQGDTWKVNDYMFVKRDNVTIGSYPGGKGSAKPVLDAQYRNTNSYYGVITVQGKGVKVQDIAVKNSGGIGVDFYKVSNGLAQNVTVEKSFRHGIRVFQSSNMTVRGCEVINHNIGLKTHKLSNWASGIVALGSKHVLFEKNIIREGWGEGINVFYGSRYVTVQDNKLYANRALGIYVDAARDVTVQRNIVLGTSNSKYYHHKEGVGAGIALNNEKFEFKSFGGSLSDSEVTQNVKILNNLVAGNLSGISVWAQHKKSNYRGIKIAHNVFVDNEGQIELAAQDIRGSNNYIGNNIFLSLSSNTRDVYNHAGASSFKFLGNAWTSKPKPQWKVQGAGDVNGGIRLAKMSGWRKITSINGDWAKQFTPATNSSTRGKGKKYSQLPVTTDFYQRKVSSSKPDMGAFAGQGGSTTTPTPVSPPIAPANFKVN
jgi:parallel beta-helix repeat protein